MSESLAGTLITIEMLAMVAASLVMARFAHRARAQLIALSGMTLAIVGSLLSLYASTDALLFVTRFMVGAGVGATIMVANIIAANFADPDKIFARLGLINLGSGAVMVWAYARFDDGSPFLFLMIVYALLLPIMAVLPRFRRFDRAADHVIAAGAQATASSPRARTLLLSGVTIGMAATSAVVWTLYAILGEQAGLSSAEVNSAIALSIFTGFAGMGLPAILGTRSGRVLPFLFGMATLTIAIVVLTSSPSATAYRIAICANVAAVYFLMPYLSGAAVAIDGGGKAAAYVSSSFFFANAIGPFFAGYLISGIGIHFLGMFVVVVATVASAAFVYSERLAARARDLSGGHDAVDVPSIGASIAPLDIAAAPQRP